MDNVPELQKRFRNAGPRSFYVILMVLLLGGYFWSGLNGYRFWGDDADTKEKHDGFTRGHHGTHGSNRFYHK